MNTNFNLKTVVIFVMLGTLALLSGFAVAKGEKWYDTDVPSLKLNSTVKDSLKASEDKYVWNTTQYWKEGNCYYYDLYVGSATNITWQDTRRELTCTTENLTSAQIDTLQAENVAWTLTQLNVVVVESNSAKVSKIKGENLKDETISDGLTTVMTKDSLILKDEQI